MMNKSTVINAIRESIYESKELTLEIFGTLEIPDNIEEYELAISSIDFIDLLIKMEEKLGIEVAEYMSLCKVKIGELAKRIVDNE